MKSVAILGCTGSIGATTLDVLRGLQDQDGADAWRVSALTAHSRVGELIELALQWQPAIVCVGDESHVAQVRQRVPSSVQVVHGTDGLAEVAAFEADIVVNGLVGAAGLIPTMSALRAGRDVAMANKEPLVMAGGLLLAAAAEHGGQILPVDSEPSAMWQCLHGERPQDVRRYLLTASGGAFRDAAVSELASVTPEQALCHPTWSMGPKITVDSATLMNKGFEAIEASWLFDVSIEQVDVVLHRESIVHSMVEFVDGSVIAHMGRTDMAIPIQYALTFPARKPTPPSILDVATLGALHFEAPDLQRFPALPLCYDVGRAGGTLPTALNAANEVAVAAFLAGEIGFLDIHKVNRAVVDGWSSEPVEDIESVLAADRVAREQAHRATDNRRAA